MRCFSRCSFKYRFKTRKRPCFKMISAVPYRFKYRQNTPFTFLVFIFFCSSKSFNISPEWTTHRTCFHWFLLQFQIVPNTVRMNHLPSLFLIFLLSSISFQVPSKFTIYRLGFKIFSAVPNSPIMHHLPSLFSYFSVQFQIVSNAVSIHRLPSLFSKVYLQFQIV